MLTGFWQQWWTRLTISGTLATGSRIAFVAAPGRRLSRGSAEFDQWTIWRYK